MKYFCKACGLCRLFINDICEHCDGPIKKQYYLSHRIIGYLNGSLLQEMMLLK